VSAHIAAVVGNRRHQRSWVLPALTCIALGSGIGAVAVAAPLIAAALLGFACALIGTAVVLRFRSVVPRLYLHALGLLLAGYVFGGRTVAYIGVPPLFIGEAMLLAGVVALLASGALHIVLRSTVAWLIFGFAAVGAAGTLPYVGRYGLDALRDAVFWGYSAFALAAAACLLRTNAVHRVTEEYRRWLLPFLLWVPPAFVAIRFLGSSVPSLPGTDVALLSIKPGDVAVHLAGAASLVLLRLDRHSEDGLEPRPSSRLFWPLWMLSLVVVSALNRGGFLSVVTTLGVISIFRPVRVGRRVALTALLIAVVGAGGLAIAVNGEPDDHAAPDGDQRQLSARQLVDNVTSIFSDRSSGAGGLSDTREWRLQWWTDIVDYTLFGPYFWTGKGFGINLADDDGYQVAGEDEAQLRSPHNAHLTVLARMGAPGAVAWLLLQCCFGALLVRAHLQARRARQDWWARLHLWILSYWCAFLVNASFDVFLEGPQGGFWSLVGFGIAALESWKRLLDWLQHRPGVVRIVAGRA
jgi:hypothetical protein